MRSPLLILIVVFFISLMGNVSAENITASWQTGQMVGLDNVEVVPISLGSDGKMDDLILGISNNIVAYSEGTQIFKWAFQRKRALGVMDYDGNGIIGDVVIGSDKIYVYKSTTSQDHIWNFSVDGNVQALKGVDYDDDGKRDELIVSTDKRIYALDPKNNSIIKSFPIGGTINSIDLIDIEGSSSKNVVVGTGRTLVDKGTVSVYSMNGAIIGKYNISDNNLAVIGVQSIDLGSVGKNTHILALFEITTANANTLAILNPDLTLNWSKENYAHASRIDFDEDGIEDDIVALRTTFGLPQIHFLNSDGSLLRTYKKSEIDTRNVPSTLLFAASFSQDTDGILNDFTLVGKDTADGYYLYGFKDAYVPTEEEKEKANLPPVAKAGEDVEILVGEEVTLSGFDSYDPEGESLQFKWLMNGKLFKDSAEKIFTYKFDKAGIYEFNLTVKEGIDIASDVVIVTVKTEGDVTPPVVEPPVNETAPPDVEEPDIGETPDVEEPDGVELPTDDEPPVVDTEVVPLITYVKIGLLTVGSLLVSILIFFRRRFQQENWMK